jgi:hypothetical protein
VASSFFIFTRASAAAKKAAYEEFERRNREITDQLRARGLHP